MSSPFSRTTLAVVIGVAGLSVLVAIGLTVFGGGRAAGSAAGADAYSVSALGHRGITELLQRLDVPVVVSRGASVAKSSSGLLVIAEPRVGTGTASADLKKLVGPLSRVLLVLPKWSPVAKRGASWIDSARPLPQADVNAVLSTFLADGEIVRVPVQGTWSGKLPPPALRSVQLIEHSTEIQPIVTLGNGVLLGLLRPGSARLWILSDPDVLNNAGLAHAENARFAVEMFEHLRAGGPIVFDETIHGYRRQPNLARVLFRFPLVLATLQVLLCALLAAWAAMVRFGPRRRAPPPLAPGKDYLLRNTAALLTYGGHHTNALERYLAVSIQSVRNVLHAPEGLSGAALTTWLDRVRLVRKTTRALADLERAVAAAPRSPQQIVELADQIHRWRMEMTHGAV